jgi:hypothetical protein
MNSCSKRKSTQTHIHKQINQYFSRAQDPKKGDLVCSDTSADTVTLASIGEVIDTIAVTENKKP